MADDHDEQEPVNVEVARIKMKKWRDEGYRNSEEIVDFGGCLLIEHANKLGDEVWVVYEQVCVAAFDCCRLDLAEECINALQKQFPNSTRVLRLKGMLYEAAQAYPLAEQLYDRILKDDPANLQIRKRKIAILKAQNRITDTIRALNMYLKEFMGDQDAWMELAELYIQHLEYSKAAFCLEELILSHPHNHLYHQRYAEIQYTIGTPDSTEKARKYFSQALKLDPNNVRALYGLFLTTSTSVNSKASKGTSKISNSKLSEWSAQQIADTFDMNVSDSQLKTLDAMFKDMQLSLPATSAE